MNKKIALAAFSLVLAAPAAAFADWHQGYAVEWYEIPTYWQGDTDANCPQGDNPKPDWHTIYNTPWRDPEDLARLDKDGGFSFGFPLGNRGPNPGMNVYRDPTLVASQSDERNEEVTGHTSLGFDLDHNTATGGFTSPDGKTSGIDNQLYRSVGCFKEYRGPPHAEGHTTPADTNYYNNDEMRTGNYTVLIMISGKGDDPKNDPNVTVGFYIAKEALPKLANNEIASDYSYRVDPDPRFMSVFEAKSVDGVITPRQPLSSLQIRDHGARPYHPWDLHLINPQISITLQDDGRADVLLGGYRNWKQYYWGWAAAGSTSETARHITLPGLWHSLEKNADGVPDPVTGKMTAISATYHMEAVPAFLITPDSNEVVTVAQLFDGIPKEVGPEADPLPLANKIRSLGGDPNFYLDGGAAAWPNNPRADIVQQGDPQPSAVASAEN